MGAGQSVDGDEFKALAMARGAFFKEHGRHPTEEEKERMAAAIARDDPTDDHLGAVTAEEADACREIARLTFKSLENREPTGDELSKRTDAMARVMRRAALEAVEPDVETVRRELVRRAVEAEKASGGGEVVPFGPPPGPRTRAPPSRPSSALRGSSTRRSGSSRPRPMVCGRRRIPS